MNTIGIAGTGVMGTDIAHITADAGFSVIMYDKDHTKLRSAYSTIDNRLKRYVDRGTMDITRVSEITSLIKLHDDIRDLCEAEIIIECVTEDIDIKKNLVSQLDEICKGGSILASNTSSISITEIASATNHPESVIGIHFMNPVRVMKLVEIVPGLTTTRETFEIARDFVKKLGKDYVESRDFPGFSLNRILYPMINEAIWLLFENAGTPESIDKLLKIGLNLPQGPLALADMIGLDIVLAIGEQMFMSYGDTKYRPCPLLRQYVSAGYLGAKSGRGFYRY